MDFKGKRGAQRHSEQHGFLACREIPDRAEIVTKFIKFNEFHSLMGFIVNPELFVVPSSDRFLLYLPLEGKLLTVNATTISALKRFKRGEELPADLSAILVQHHVIVTAPRIQNPASKEYTPTSLTLDAHLQLQSGMRILLCVRWGECRKTNGLGCGENSYRPCYCERHSEEHT